MKIKFLIFLYYTANLKFFFHKLSILKCKDKLMISNFRHKKKYIYTPVRFT